MGHPERESTSIQKPSWVQTCVRPWGHHEEPEMDSVLEELAVPGEAGLTALLRAGHGSGPWKGTVLGDSLWTSDGRVWNQKAFPL